MIYPGPIKLLLLDLDGTLLDSQKRLLPEARLAVRQALDAGIQVTLATGRMGLAVLPLARELGVRTPLICNNGADLVEPTSGECLSKLTLEPAAARLALEFAREVGVSVALFAGTTVLTPERTADHWLIERNYEPVSVRPLAELLAAPPASEKLLLLDYAQPERLPALRDEFRRRFAAAGIPFLVEITEPGILNICHPDSGKAPAMRRLCQRLGIRPAECMAVGDSDNDAGMVALAGLGVAMGNATAPTLAAATAVVEDCDHAGVVTAICGRLLGGRFEPDQPGYLALALRDLRLRVRELGSLLLAFSGGVDSSLVLRVAVDELPPDRLLAVTAHSAVFPEADRGAAAALAASLGVRREILHTDEQNQRLWYGTNPQERCYICKKAFFGKLQELARERGLAAVVDGENADDLALHRPGRQAAVECGVRSPLAEAGLSKATVRALSRELGLAEWQRPPNACLATRFPYGTVLTAEKLERVARAEAALAARGYGQIRVRVYADRARIEVAPGHVSRAAAEQGELEQLLRPLGFATVEVDPEGYRMGRMDQPAALSPP